MYLSGVAGQAAIDGSKVLMNGGSLVLYSGPMPVSTGTALSGNTALAALALAATAFGPSTVSGGFAQAPAAFTTTSYTPTTNGYANFAQMLKSDGVTVFSYATVVAPYVGVAFTPPVGFLCTNAGNTYKATTVAGAGVGTAPTGTTTAVDGGITWTYVGAGTLGDTVLTSSLIQTAQPITSPTMTLKIPVN